MDDRYLKQATLIVKCIPAIAAEDCFAIIWKRKNLETLKQSNPAKFAEQRKLLEGETRDWPRECGLGENLTRRQSEKVKQRPCRYKIPCRNTPASARTSRDSSL